MIHRILTLFLGAAALAAIGACASHTAPGTTSVSPHDQANRAFADLAARFVDEFPARSPVVATGLGDHRYDHLLNEISAAQRRGDVAFNRRYLAGLAAIDWDLLTPDHQIDAEVLRNQLEFSVWRQEVLEEWAWNPMVYSGLAGGSIYSLMARDFAPIEERLKDATARLEALPRLFAQVRETLDVARVPAVHAETAARQNGGVKSIIGALIEPQMANLGDADRARLAAAIDTATQAVDEHQVWLDETLVPGAQGDFRIGAELFDRKLAFALHSPLSRQEVSRRARAEFDRVRSEMYEVARSVVDTEASANPDPATQQAVIQAALEKAYERKPGRDDIVETARRNLAQATAFVREKNLVEVPDDPLEIIIMPEFQRGVAIAYCDSPGPLDKGQKTFYAVAPLPDNWTDEQVDSFLREYNLLSIQDLTIHEAMPGHFLQLALSNRHPSTLRAALYSGPFVEGWAVYAERVMIDAGYLDGDPLMRLINLKWYLRAVTNAIIDQAIHVDGMTRDEAMKLMTEGAFQEEREAAGKWVRAQLTSTQLSTYFVGYQEHADLRRDTEKAWGKRFNQRMYHDAVLSFGSPPAQFVRARLLGLPIPRS